MSNLICQECDKYVIIGLGDEMIKLRYWHANSPDSEIERIEWLNDKFSPTDKEPEWLDVYGMFELFIGHCVDDLEQLKKEAK